MIKLFKPLFLGILLSMPLSVTAEPSLEAEFLKYGHSLDWKDSPLTEKEKAKHKKALGKFPSAGKCILKPNKAQNLTSQKLAQNKITSLIELEVCLFQVANHFNDIGKTKKIY